MEEDQMSEYKLSCERFLAVTRQHFLAGDGASSAQHEGDDNSSGCGGETPHQVLSGG